MFKKPQVIKMEQLFNNYKKIVNQAVIAGIISEEKRMSYLSKYPLTNELQRNELNTFLTDESLSSRNTKCMRPQINGEWSKSSKPLKREKDYTNILNHENVMSHEHHGAIDSAEEDLTSRYKPTKNEIVELIYNKFENSNFSRRKSRVEKEEITHVNWEEFKLLPRTIKYQRNKEMKDFSLPKIRISPRLKKILTPSKKLKRKMASLSKRGYRKQEIKNKLGIRLNSFDNLLPMQHFDNSEEIESANETPRVSINNDLNIPNPVEKSKNLELCRQLAKNFNPDDFQENLQKDVTRSTNQKCSSKRSQSFGGSDKMLKINIIYQFFPRETELKRFCSPTKDKQQKISSENKPKKEKKSHKKTANYLSKIFSKKKL